ncbi:MAG TPA: hypothetical protein VM938_08165 [Acidimicrobiales bacterium]|nr:hypothetical protein [Acidimicrobiales bacterium]
MKRKDVVRDLRAALPGWVAARVVVAATFAFAHWFADRTDPPLWSVRHLQEGLLGWDAVRYEQIARFGYEALPQQELRFFPLLPMLARGLGFLFGGHHGVALLVISSVSALAFGALMHRLVLSEANDSAMARRATWFVALAPAAFVFVWGYSESLAGALTAAGFLALKKRAWWWVAGIGVFLGLTRPVGLLFMVPVALVALREFRIRQLGRMAAALLAPVAGAAMYCAWVWRAFGDPMIPFQIQQQDNFRGPVISPLGPLAAAIGDAFAGTWQDNVRHLPWIAVAVVLVVVCFKHWPLPYAAFAAVTVVVALSADWWGSFERYVFSTVPIVLAAASASRTKWRERAMLVVGAAAMGTYNVLALLGSYVP